MSTAVVVAPRVYMAAAAAALPSLLPTPPRSKMLPLLPTPCLIILPASFATSASKVPKPGRADAVERWDAHKRPIGSAAPSSSSCSSAGGSPGRADAVERWDAHKKPAGRSAAPSSRSSSVSPSRAAACERKEPGSPASSSSSASSGGKPGRADTCERWDINKIKNPSSRTPPMITERSDDYSNKRPASRGSSAERWDINKKHHSQDDAAAAALGSASDRQLTMVKPSQRMFSGPAFFSSPEPSMLPMRTLLLAR